MNRLLQIDSIMYRVRDLDESAKFYSELGMTQRWRDEASQMVGFTFPNSDSELVIHRDPTLPDFDFSYLVDDVEDFCREHHERGYAVAMQAIRVRSGRYAVLLDPDGNRIPIIDLTSFDGKPRYDAP